MTILDRYPQAPGQARSGEWLVVEGVKKAFEKRMVVKGVSVNLKRRESAGLLAQTARAGHLLPSRRPNGAGRGAPGY